MSTSVVSELASFMLLNSIGHFDPRSDSARRLSHVQLRDLFQRLCVKLNIKRTIEVGAREALFSQEIKLRLPNAIAIAYEGNPYTFRHFKVRAGLVESGVDYRLGIISDVVGPAMIKIPTRLGQIPGNTSLLARNDDSDYELVEVESTTLDNIGTVSEGQSALWLDVEGATLSVLRGGRHFLRSCDLVFVEVEEAEFWQGGARAHEVLNFLMTEGFVPLARDMETPKQYNIIFARAGVSEPLRFEFACWLHDVRSA